jgi:Ca2+-transporting ATPase
MQKPWHSLKFDEIFKSLETSPGGLLQAEASERLRRFGPNSIEEPEKVSALKILIGEVTSFFNIILFFSAFVALSVGFLPGHVPKYHEVIFIFAIIILNTIISFIEEYKAAQSIQALHKVMKLKVKVLVLSHFKWVMREEIHRNSPLIKGIRVLGSPFVKGD